MSGKTEYLEKYSVAPSPSRDYYGLKVLRDEVILHLWKISHGPHKTPVVRAVKFIHFEQDKSLHDEIRRAFGEHLLRYARNVARGGEKTLLTLPKDLIERLLRYLSINDVVTLSSLSHVAREIFDNNSTWKILYKRYVSTKSSNFERYYDLTYDWKRLFKEERMQRKGPLVYEQKNPKARSESKLTRPKVEKQNLTNRYILTSKTTSKADVFTNDLSERLAMLEKKVSKNAISNKSSDIRLTGISISEKPGSDLAKRSTSIKSLQSVPQRNIKTIREGALASSKRAFPSANNKQNDKSLKDSAYNKSIESKVAKGPENPAASVTRPKTSTTRITRTENNTNVNSQKSSKTPTNPSAKAGKAVEHAMTNPNKSRVKNKSKKLGQSKSTILSTDAALLKDSRAAGENSLDLADLIEASLKNTHSPRSIFDYDFSCLQNLTSCASEVSARRASDSSRRLGVARGKMMLERLSERSESSTARSKNAFSRKNAEVDANDKLDDLSLVNAYRKNDAVKTSKFSGLSSKSRESDGNESGNLTRYGVYNKCSMPRSCELVDKKESELQTPLDRMSLLRSLKLSSLFQDTSLASRESSGTVANSRYHS